MLLNSECKYYSARYGVIITLLCLQPDKIVLYLSLHALDNFVTEWTILVIKGEASASIHAD